MCGFSVETNSRRRGEYYAYRIYSNKHPPRISAHPDPTLLPLPTLFRVLYRNLALLRLRVLLLPCIVLLQNKHTTLAENGENLISAHPRMGAHSQGPKKLNKRPGLLNE